MIRQIWRQGAARLLLSILLVFFATAIYFFIPEIRQFPYAYASLVLVCFLASTWIFFKFKKRLNGRTVITHVSPWLVGKEFDDLDLFLPYLQMSQETQRR